MLALKNKDFTKQRESPCMNQRDGMQIELTMLSPDADNSHPEIMPNKSWIYGEFVSQRLESRSLRLDRPPRVTPRRSQRMEASF